MKITVNNRNDIKNMLNSVPLRSWQHRATPADYNWMDVCYGDGLFVAVANTGTTANRIMISSDGVTWTQKTHPDHLLSSVYHYNGLFIAGGYDSYNNTVVLTSNNGSTWAVKAYVPVTDKTAKPSKIISGNGIIVGVGYADSMRPHFILSLDGGETWGKSNAVPEYDFYNTVCFHAGYFYALGADGKILRSSNGLDWFHYGDVGFGNAWADICYGNGLFVAVDGGMSGGRIAVSSDCLNWESLNVTSKKVSSICYENGLFVAPESDSLDSLVWYSFNGLDWKAVKPSINKSWIRTCYGNNKFVSVAGNSSTDGNRILNSGMLHE